MQKAQVNGNVRHVFQRWFGEITLKPLFFNVPDGVPRHSEMPGDVLASRRLKQVKHVSGEESGVTFLLFGEGKVDLPPSLAVLAKNAGNVKDDAGLFTSDRNGPESSGVAAFSPDVRRSATGADGSMAFDGKFDASRNDLLFDELVASDAKHVIQYRCGHGVAPLRERM